MIMVVGMLCFSCATPAIVATQTIQKGDAANNENRYEEAIKHYEAYIKSSSQLGMYRNPSMEASVFRKLAYAYSTQGKYSQSVRYLHNALAIDSTIATNALEVIEDFRDLGRVHAYMSEYKEALRYLSRSLMLNKDMAGSLKNVKRTSLADTYMSLSQVHLTLGNYKEAERFGSDALEVYNKIQDEYAGVIEAALLLGIINRERGRLADATRLVEQSKKLAEQNQLNTTRQNQALGEIYFLQGDPENGIRFKLLAANQAEQSNIKPQIIISYMRLGDAYQQLGDQSKANDYYQKALRIQTEIQSDTVGAVMPSLNLRLGDIQKAYDHYMQSGSSVGGALVCLRLGEMQFQKKDSDSARIMFLKAKSLFEKSGSVEGINKANVELSKVYTKAKDYAQAKTLLVQAGRATIQPDLKWQINYRLGIIHENTGQFDSAYHSYKKAIQLIDSMRGNLSIEEFKTLFSNSKVEVYSSIITLLLQHEISGISAHNAVTSAFGYNEQSRSRAFLDMLGNQKIEAKSIRDVGLLENEQLLRLKIQHLAMELNKRVQYDAGRRQVEEELTKAQHDYDNLIQQIKLSNDAYATIVSVEPPEVEKIQALLDDKTAILEYWLGDEHLILWMITHSSIVSKVMPVSRRDVQREVAYCRRSIAMRLQDGVERSTKILSEHLINPVLNELKGFENLIIVPHRDLHFLPFQTLLSGPGKFLIEDHVVSYAPSAAVLYYCLNEKITVGNNFLGVALGNLSIGAFPGLPGTELELDELSKLYPDMSSQRREGFSETYVKQHIQDKNYIHIATHGILNKTQPLYTYLLMSSSEQDDGRLTVNEIFGMDLQCKLVTLSACETGLGDIGEGDDLTGLSRAFIYAGSASVIVSLWKVDDAMTAWIMVRFYQYIQQKHAAAEALALAQRDLIQRNIKAGNNGGIMDTEMSREMMTTITTRNHETLKNPFYWAPFVLIGNGAIK